MNIHGIIIVVLLTTLVSSLLVQIDCHEYDNMISDVLDEEMALFGKVMGSGKVIAVIDSHASYKGFDPDTPAKPTMSDYENHVTMQKEDYNKKQRPLLKNITPNSHKEYDGLVEVTTRYHKSPTITAFWASI